MQRDSPFDHDQQDNAVSYELYSSTDYNQDKLKNLQMECLAVTMPDLIGYIWQQDPFTLHSSTVIQPPWSNANARRQHDRHLDQPATAHLWGFTRFGDNIEDEWFIAWLLYKITTKFNNVSARIWDNDGDFLLIEAAYSLPKWLKPETSNNRVWLQSGCLHVIPLPNKHHPTLPAAPTVHQALQILSADSIRTKANSGMQEAIKARIKGYPRKAHAEMHRARCNLPIRVAHVLQQKPQLVSPAVQTFHYRDIQDMKAAAKLALFPPQDLVTTIITFNQALYAQLAQQQFEPPRGYPLPPQNNPAFKAADLGMKLTCGFEMLMAKHSSGSQPAAAASPGSQGMQMDAADLQDNPQWAAFKASLTKNGYFKGNIAGSAQYKELLAEAAQSFMHSQEQHQAIEATEAPAETIASILQQLMCPEQFKDGPEDDDSWMTGGAADLEAELAKRQKELEGNVAKHAKRTAQGLAGPEAAPEFDPSEMVSKMKAFVDQVSGHEGAEVPENTPPDVSLDDPSFWRELKAALGVAADQHGVDLDSDLPSASSSDGFTDDHDSSSESGYSDSAASAGKSQGSNLTQFAKATAAVPVKGFTASASEQHPSAAHSKAAPDNEQSDDEASEVLTATDSDDDGDAGFMHAYDQALADQLSHSQVGSILKSTEAETGNQTKNAQAQAGGSNDLKPVDLDTNLVRNLLQSYTAQQGLAGPAGNLAGLLGLNLPHNAETN